MLFHPSGRTNLFLLVRTHAQLQYYLNLSDSQRAANQGAILQTAGLSDQGKVAEIHPLHLPTLRRRG
jgi:hypothetical protein